MKIRWSNVNSLLPPSFPETAAAISCDEKSMAPKRIEIIVVAIIRTNSKSSQNWSARRPFIGESAWQVSEYFPQCPDRNTSAHVLECDKSGSSSLLPFPPLQAASWLVLPCPGDQNRILSSGSPADCSQQ